MRKYLILLLCGLCLSVYSGYSQVPANHPAMQMRRYYADVYTKTSIITFESTKLDSILYVVTQFIEPAQVISVYSYKENPYNYRPNTFTNHDFGQIKSNPQKVPENHTFSADNGFALLPNDEGLPRLYPVKISYPHR